MNLRDNKLLTNNCIMYRQRTGLSLERLTRMEFTGKYYQNNKCSIQQHFFSTIEHFNNPLKNQNTQEIDYENKNELNTSEHVKIMKIF